MASCQISIKQKPCEKLKILSWDEPSGASILCLIKTLILT